MAKKFLEGSDAPLHDPMVDPGSGFLGTPWEDWFQRLSMTLTAIPSILNVVSLSTQEASIAATDFSNSVVVRGLHRVCYRTRIARPATTSSSLRVTVVWSEGGVTQTHTGTAVTGNTTTSRSSALFMLRPDAGSTITYATTYASVGATSMRYTFDISLEYLRSQGAQ